MRKNFFIYLTTLFFGSWYSVIGHTLLFVLIILVKKDLLFFNTLVSIEAIYIGVFILMAEYRQELAHEKKEIERRSRDRKLVREDVQLTQDVINELKHIKIQLKKTEQLMRDIGKNSKMQ